MSEISNPYVQPCCPCNMTREQAIDYINHSTPLGIDQKERQKYST